MYSITSVLLRSDSDVLEMGPYMSLDESSNARLSSVFSRLFLSRGYPQNPVTDSCLSTSFDLVLGIFVLSRGRLPHPLSLQQWAWAKIAAWASQGFLCNIKSNML